MGALSPVNINESDGIGDEADSWLPPAGSSVSDDTNSEDGDVPTGGSPLVQASGRPVSRQSVLSVSRDSSPEHSENAPDDATPLTGMANDVANDEADSTSRQAVEVISNTATELPNPADALNQLIEDSRYRSDRAYADYVAQQFEQVYGTDATTDATGRLIADGDFSKFVPVADQSSVMGEAVDEKGARSDISMRDSVEPSGTSSRVAPHEEIGAWLRDRSVEVAENPKPKTATDAAGTDGQRNANILDLPAFKVEYFKSQPGAWESFNEALARDPKILQNQRQIYAEIFAMEGGMKTHPTSGAASKITPDILELARDDLPGLEKVQKPDQLTVAQRAAICPYYFDDVLRTVGGRKALDEIGNDNAAAAFADTLFRFGRGRGTEIIQDAMNRVFRENGYPEMPKDRQMGPGTLAAYSYLVADERLAKQLSKYLADRRIEQLKGERNDERDRSSYFEFSRIRP